MIFLGQPGQLVRFRPSMVRGRKIGFRFDKNGEYETENPRLIRILKAKYEIKENYKCKKCEFETDNKGVLMAHYKTHKKEV